jgi:hypothetical protein
MPAVIVDPSRALAAGWAPRYAFDEGVRGVWEEWSAADADTILTGMPVAPVSAS